MKTIDQDEDVAIHGYTIVNQWAVDNTFFRIETVFLHHLLNDLITRCPETEKVKKFRQAKIDLYQLEAYERYIEELLEQQMKDLSGVVKDSLDVDADLAAKQKKLQKLMAGLTLEYRAFKQILFALSKEEMKKRV
jgi:septal ring factor EnvC (AmiA/AmiB activator)